MNRYFLTGLVILLAVNTGCVSDRPAEPERGRYMVEIMGCNDCHTPKYLAKHGDVPVEDWLIGDTLGYFGTWGTAYPTNLRLLLNRISLEEWITLARTMREESPMTWVMLPKLTNDDLRAVYHFIRTLGPKGEEAPPGLPPGVLPDGPYVNFPKPH